MPGRPRKATLFGIKPASVFVLALILSSPVFAQCEDDSIESVSSDGSIIIMISGEVFRVSPVDQADSAVWLPADDVLICNDAEIINTGENGERVAVTRLR